MSNENRIEANPAAVFGCGSCVDSPCAFFNSDIDLTIGAAMAVFRKPDRHFTGTPAAP